MEDLENTMEELIFDFLICWRWFGSNHKQVLWLSRNPNV